MVIPSTRGVIGMSRRLLTNLDPVVSPTPLPPLTTVLDDDNAVAVVSQVRAPDGSTAIPRDTEEAAAATARHAAVDDDDSFAVAAIEVANNGWQTGE